MTLVVSDGSTVACESVDLSLGGMRVTAVDAIPLGLVRVVVDDLLSVEAAVLEVLYDVATGTVSARMEFEPAAPSDAGLVTLVDGAAPEASENGRRRAPARARAVMGAVGVVALLVAGGSGIASSLGRPTSDSSTTTSATATVRPPVAPLRALSPEITSARASVSRPPAAPATGSVEHTDVDVAPSLGPSGGEPTPTAAPAAPPVPAAVTTTEPADSRVTVTIAADPADNSASATVGPSAGVDRVRVLLHVGLEPVGTTYPVAMTIENRSDDVLTFPGGAAAEIRAASDGALVHEITVRRDDLVELAPGATATLDGVLPLEQGTYELTAAVDVTAPAA